MSAVTRCVSLTALVALFGVAAASDVKGPVHISAGGVTHYNGDTARFHDAMEADERGEVELASSGHVHSRRVADIARAEARRAADEARALGLAARRDAERIAAEARAEAREAAEAGREAAREAQREAREAARRAARETRVHVARAMAEADEAMRGVRERLAEARREIAARAREMQTHRHELDDAHGNRWDNAIEIRDGKVVRCSDPAKYPGTGCTPFTPEEKARIEADVHAAGEQARAAMAKAEAGLRAAERALNAETWP